MLRTLAQKLKTDTGIVIVFLILIALELGWSFMYPAYKADADCWISVEQLQTVPFVRSITNAEEQNWLARFKRVSPDYHLICDNKAFLLLVKNIFPADSKGFFVYMDQLLYPLLIFPVAKIISFVTGVWNFVVVFIAGIAVNFLFAALSSILLYHLVRHFMSQRIAFLSAVLLALSPFNHVFIAQITNSGPLEPFIVIASFWLLLKYSQQPSAKRLILYSLLFGVLMLGKMIYALAFFALIIALLSRQIKKGIAFLLLQAVPLVLWFLFVHLVLKMPYNVYEVSTYGFGTWILNIFSVPVAETIAILVRSIPNFATMLLFGFIIIPVLLAFYGVSKMQKPRATYFFSILLSFFLLFLAMNYYRVSLGFLVFPAIYPAAVFGLERIRDAVQHKWNKRAGAVLFYGVIGVIIVLSNLNILEFLPYA